MTEQLYFQKPDGAVYGLAVHVHKGRRLHRALNKVKTLCGQSWVATWLDGADLPPDCTKCRHEMGLS